MTKDEFFAAFSKFKPYKKFMLTRQYGPLRSVDNECPLCFVANKLGLSKCHLDIEANQAMLCLNMSLDDASAIAKAADWDLGPTRDKLLKICKFKEPV